MKKSILYLSLLIIIPIFMNSLETQAMDNYKQDKGALKQQKKQDKKDAKNNYKQNKKTMGKKSAKQQKKQDKKSAKSNYKQGKKDLKASR